MGLKRSAGSSWSFCMIKCLPTDWHFWDICNWAKTCFLPIICSVFNIFQKCQNKKCSTFQEQHFGLSIIFQSYFCQSQSVFAFQKSKKNAQICPNLPGQKFWAIFFHQLFFHLILRHFCQKKYFDLETAVFPGGFLCFGPNPER